MRALARSFHTTPLQQSKAIINSPGRPLDSYPSYNNAQYIGTIANSLNQVTIDRHNDPPFALTRMPANLPLAGRVSTRVFTS